MKISNINNFSFGKKIVISNCTIQDKKTGKPVQAKFCEYDCTDMDDIAEFNKRSDCPLPFRLQIAANMEDKLINPAGEANQHFYAIEAEDGMNAGIAHTQELDDRFEIVQMGTNKKAYNAAGKNLVAGIANEIKKDGSGKMLHAWAPVPDAIPFYTHVCGFGFDNEYNLIADPNKLDIKV